MSEPLFRIDNAILLFFLPRTIILFSRSYFKKCFHVTHFWCATAFQVVKHRSHINSFFVSYILCIFFFEILISTYSTLTKNTLFQALYWLRNHSTSIHLNNLYNDAFYNSIFIYMKNSTLDDCVGNAVIHTKKKL